METAAWGQDGESSLSTELPSTNWNTAGSWKCAHPPVWSNEVSFLLKECPTIFASCSMCDSIQQESIWEAVLWTRWDQQMKEGNCLFLTSHMTREKQLTPCMRYRLEYLRLRWMYCYHLWWTTEVFAHGCNFGDYCRKHWLKLWAHATTCTAKHL